eukprot:INCI3995.1.p1 GENE.INCI3995.1~~INCI3995.1.p1  ORF type:complete len:212 (+),score=19.96 INCI3995.1:130-765(+)
MKTSFLSFVALVMATSSTFSRVVAVDSEALHGRLSARSQLALAAGNEVDAGVETKYKCCICEKWDGARFTGGVKKQCFAEAVRKETAFFRSTSDGIGCSQACTDAGATQVTTGTKKHSRACRDTELMCNDMVSYSDHTKNKYCHCSMTGGRVAIGQRTASTIRRCYVEGSAGKPCADICASFDFDTKVAPTMNSEPYSRSTTRRLPGREMC